MEEVAPTSSRFDGSTRIGPYQLLAKLAEGGMGTVYLATMDGPAGFTKLAVVKELKERLVGSPRFAELFLDEARLAARLTHPNVVHTYGAGEEEGRLYIAMEYLDGQPWGRAQRRLRSNGELPMDSQLKVLADALLGLHYAHELKDFDGTPFNVVHCDMSPQNVFITYDGQVKVVDFGVARATHTQRETGGSVFLGKVAYCAPEQARGESMDRRADIFSVGVMLFEALSCKRFATGTAPVTTLRTRGTGGEPRVREVAPDLPANLANICDRALSLAPDDRYATAAEFRAELLDFMTHTGRDVEGSQLGELVSGAFETESSQLHGLIDEHLRERTGSLRPVANLQEESAGEPNESTLHADLSRLASVTRMADEDNVASIISSSLVDAASHDIETPLVPPAPAAKPRRRARLWLSVGVLLMSTAAFVVAWFGRDLTLADAPTPTSEPMPAVATPLTASLSQSPPEPPLTPKTLALTIEALPEGAQLFLDGNQLDRNPFSAQLTLDNSVHTLKAAATGYKSEQRAVVFDHDLDIGFELKRKPEPERAAADEADRATTRHRRRRTEPAKLAEPEVAAQPMPPPVGQADGTSSVPTPVPPPPVVPKKPSGMTIYDEDPY